MSSQNLENNARHKPVLIDDIIRLSAPVKGVWLDGTFPLSLCLQWDVE